MTLSGEGQRRILYMDTCDPAQVWTTSHCQDQASPKLVIQDLAFTDGNSSGERFDGGGGGAIFARGGQLRIVNSVFTGNRCEHQGPDIGGGAVRALSQYRGLPVYVVKSRFTGNVCSNGGALSSIGVSWSVLNSRFIANRAIGNGANPARPGSPGGGSGGAIYNDGDQMRLSIGGSLFADNRANEGGGAIFFVSDDRTGTMAIGHTTLKRNRNDRFHTAGLPGIFFLGARRPDDHRLHLAIALNLALAFAASAGGAGLHPAVAVNRRLAFAGWAAGGVGRSSCAPGSPVRSLPRGDSSSRRLDAGA